MPRPPGRRASDSIAGSVLSPASGTRRRTGTTRATGQDPAAVAPGKDDIVTIDAAANGAAQVVIGSGNAYSLTLGGETLLEGQFNVGAGGFTESPSASAVLYSGSALDVSGAATFNNDAGATLDGGAMTVTGAFNGGYGSPFVMKNGGSLTAVQIVDYYYGTYSVFAGDTLTVTGGVYDGTSGYDSSFTVNGGAFTVKGTFTSSSDGVYAENGGTGPARLAGGGFARLRRHPLRLRRDLVDRDRHDGRRRGWDDHHRRRQDGDGGRHLLRADDCQ